MILTLKSILSRELQLPKSCLNNEDNVEVKGFKFESLTEEFREKRYYKHCFSHVLKNVVKKKFRQIGSIVL